MVVVKRVPTLDSSSRPPCPDLLCALCESLCGSSLADLSSSVALFGFLSQSFFKDKSNLISFLTFYSLEQSYGAPVHTTQHHMTLPHYVMYLACKIPCVLVITAVSVMSHQRLG
ncbi:hypothetical protein RRG08_044293 [Elysia crispata]|uniref:Uncharacterized protein n=1 Tax=Elysia crispata TaxID=231223 RepID=A0AAE0XXK2_9GAST|nr:hypothetical protein RRG08_044293 [Elysia crispata]